MEDATDVWKIILNLESVFNSSFNLLKPNGNYMSHLLQQSVTLHFVFMDFV
jgi:hypothetical protein